MPSWTWYALWGLKVNEGVTPWSLSIKQADVFDSIQRDPHCNLSRKQKVEHDNLKLKLVFSRRVGHLISEVRTFSNRGFT